MWLRKAYNPIQSGCPYAQRYSFPKQKKNAMASNPMIFLKYILHINYGLLPTAYLLLFLNFSPNNHNSTGAGKPIQIAAKPTTLFPQP